MAESDLSRIVNLIMENPSLVSQIKALADKPTESVDTDITDTDEAVGENTEEVAQLTQKTVSTPTPVPHSRRKDLLVALKPYLSEQRGKAMETMMSIVDIIDMMKTR